jgi:23S rRNA (adenine2503-C2)-methyltransferase
MKKQQSIYNFDKNSIHQLMASWKEPSFRSNQLWQGIYTQLWRDPEDFSNLSKSLRKKLSEHFSFDNLKPEKYMVSTDGETSKTLFRLHDGHAIETILMKYHTRRTLCISTQVGCALGCTFCATGQMGFKRNLSSGEIIEQVIYHSRLLKETEERLTNIVVMGMGEPFLNYQATIAAIDRLNDASGFGERRFTISTAGVIPGIEEFAKERRQINLAISLHATQDELRSQIMPINKKYPVGDLLKACRDYTKTTNRRITFEWALIKNFNDSIHQAQALIDKLKGMLCHVNLIPLNPTEKFSGFATSQQKAKEFQSILDGAGIPCSIRTRRGLDIQAGCGQLAITNGKAGICIDDFQT